MQREVEYVQRAMVRVGWNNGTICAWVIAHILRPMEMFYGIVCRVAVTSISQCFTSQSKLVGAVLAWTRLILPP